MSKIDRSLQKAVKSMNTVWAKFIVLNYNIRYNYIL